MTQTNANTADYLDGLSGLKVVEITYSADTSLVEYGLVPLGVDPLDDTTLKFVINTTNEALHQELRLNTVVGGNSVDLEASAAGAVGGFFKSIGLTVAKAFGYTVTADQKSATEKAVVAFVGKDGLQLALDAVAYVGTLGNLSGVQARDAAVAKFKADAVIARKDFTDLAGAVLNFVIEGALQIAISKGLVALATATAAI